MRQKQDKKHLLTLVWVLYILGFLIFSYPFAAKKYHQIVQNSAVKEYKKESLESEKKASEKRAKLEKEHEKEIALAPENQVKDFDIEAEKLMREQGIASSGRDELGEVIAILEIPKIKLELPVYYGTNSKQISSGVGVMRETSLPFGGEGTHSVLTSHRGLPTAKLFTDLPQLKIGDSFFLTVGADIHAYEVDQIKVIEPDDFSALEVIPGEDYVTLLTCTPYMINTHRMLVRGKRVMPYDAKVKAQEMKKGYWRQIKQLLILLLILLLLLLLYILKKQMDKRKQMDPIPDQLNPKKIRVRVRVPIQTSEHIQIVPPLDSTSPKKKKRIKVKKRVDN